MSTFVLVHGAWHGGWCWEKVVPLLKKEGHEVVVVDLPGHGDNHVPVPEVTLAAYGDHVAGVLDEQAEPVVLVGHSMGGLAISEVAYGDCSEEDVEWAKSHLIPQPLAPFVTPVQVSETHYGSVRRTYIECLQDKAIGPAAQKRMYTDTPCEKVVSMETSHSPFLSQPEELAGHLDSLAKL